MFKNTIKKAAIGALALSGVATQAALTLNDFNGYGGFHWAGKLMKSNQEGYTPLPKMEWRDIPPSKLSDIANFGATVGVAINPAKTGIPMSVEFGAQTFAEAAQTEIPRPGSSNESIEDTRAKVDKASANTTYASSVFVGPQVKFHYAIGESLDAVGGFGLGSIFEQHGGKDAYNLAIPIHLGVKYQLSDNMYIPFGFQYFWSPKHDNDSMRHNTTFNIGFHYHF